MGPKGKASGDKSPGWLDADGTFVKKLAVILHRHPVKKSMESVWGDRPIRFAPFS